jgi:serine/threonine protein kinase
MSPDLSNAKVICGDSAIFSAQLLTEESRFVSPEILDGDQETDAQIWWDLGVILYELASGNFAPFNHGNPAVRKRLIRRYQVVFPQNLPYAVSDELKNLIRELLCKDKNVRLGYVDQGGVEDVREDPFL